MDSCTLHTLYQAPKSGSRRELLGSCTLHTPYQTHQACVWFIATLVACHTFLATWSTCHRLNFLPNLATLVVTILLATFFVADTLCLSSVVAKLVMNEVQPWSLLDSTCGRIWWNVDDIQWPVVLGFAMFVPSDWLHPTTNFQSYSHTI